MAESGVGYTASVLLNAVSIVGLFDSLCDGKEEAMKTFIDVRTSSKMQLRVSFSIFIQKTSSLDGSIPTNSVGSRSTLC